MNAKHLLILSTGCLLAACTTPPPKSSETLAATRTPIVVPTATEILSPEEQTVLASPEAIVTTLGWQAAAGLSSYPLQMLGGWEPGFRDADYCLAGPYRWLDEQHLLVFPIAGNTFIDGQPYSDWTHPIVIGVEDETLWAISEPEPFCALPAWSASLGRLVEVARREVQVRDLQGKVTATHPGQKPLSLSPSGLGLLAGDTWIDLQDGSNTALDPAWQAAGTHKVAWSLDEQHIFGCCFHYADRASGEAWHQDEFAGFFIAGRGSWPGEEVVSTSHWLTEDPIFVDTLAVWFMSDQDPTQTVIPIFSPFERSYIDLLEELGLDTPSSCSASLVPGAQHLWLSCTIQENQETLRYSEAYVVALPSLAVITIPGNPQLLGWSADGAYAVYNRSNQNDIPESWLFDASTGQSRLLNSQAMQAVSWHPEFPTGVLYNPGSEVLLFFNAESGQTRSQAAKAGVQQAIWQPGAPSIVLQTGQDSLWWLSDVFASDSHLEQLVRPLPEPHSVRWSPGGTRLAFVSDAALYVITLPSEGASQ